MCIRDRRKSGYYKKNEHLQLLLLLRWLAPEKLLLAQVRLRERGRKSEERGRRRRRKQELF